MEWSTRGQETSEHLRRLCIEIQEGHKTPEEPLRPPSVKFESEKVRDLAEVGGMAGWMLVGCERGRKGIFG